MADYVTLSCPSCGGKLEITPDIDRFACSHCGREHVVKRAGGLVSISPIVDALKQVEVGVDRTAAELAIARIQKELVYLQITRANLLQTSPPPSTNSLSFILLIIIGGVLISLSLLLLFSIDKSDILLPLSMAGLGIISGLIGAIPLFILQPMYKESWRKTTGTQLKLLDEQIATQNADLQHYKITVSR
jgi:hypothetical protein